MRPEPDGKEPQAGSRRLPILREPEEPPEPDAGERAGSAGPVLLPGTPGVLPVSPWLREPPGAGRRALRRSTARPEPNRWVPVP